MMSKLRKDIETILDAPKFNQYGNSANDAFFYERVYAYSNVELTEAFANTNIQFSEVDQYGGEGQGDDYWIVYKFSRDDEVEYLQFDGWYSSYNGAEFNKRFWVKPKEVVVTKFYKDE